MDRIRTAFPLSELALKKILVPIDFSPSSRKALLYAIPLAAQFHAEISLLHVLEVFYPPTKMIMVDTPFLEEKAFAQAKNELADWGKQVLDAGVTISVERGNPYLVIVDTARKSRTDLIVMGHRGRSGLEHFLLGGTVERVVRHSSCPVLVVREVEHDFLGSASEAEVKPVRSRSKTKRAAGKK